MLRNFKNFSTLFCQRLFEKTHFISKSTQTPWNVVSDLYAGFSIFESCVAGKMNI